jgi:hypothetical protein
MVQVQRIVNSLSGETQEKKQQKQKLHNAMQKADSAHTACLLHVIVVCGVTTGFPPSFSLIYVQSAAWRR